MNFIELNKFSELHDRKKIVFCKTDFLLSDFDAIRKLPNEIVLISGNSDYPIVGFENIINDINQCNQPWSHEVNLPPWGFFGGMPSNIRKWYGQNIFINHPKFVPLPLGLECTNFCVRDGHGIGYPERGAEKERLIRRNIYDIAPTKFIYSNFFINNKHREKFKQISVTASHINWEEHTLSLEDFFNRISQHEMVLCPMGNGLDTHRLWETLYCGRIPITGRVGNFKIYELYEQLPIVILDNVEQLLDYDFMRSQLEKAKSKIWNKNLLDADYWKSIILEEASKI